MAEIRDKSVPIVDLFAGPGGLGEGFSAFRTPDGFSPFRVVLSIEKDRYAHQTLTLRSFFRQFPSGAAPEEYYGYLWRADEPETERRKQLFGAWPEEAARAEAAALLIELGREATESVRERIRQALEGSDEFILLGGPPCQAYSVMGRSRNRGNPDYRAKTDTRQRLYVEYLQVLADHGPAVFIMENVKGLLSATLDSQRVFERILEDLRSPCDAVLREERGLADGRRRTRYNLYALGCDAKDDTKDLRQFVVRMERHGIPQARHRLIIVGVRSDLKPSQIHALPEADPVAVKQVISDLPLVRSGLSREQDSLASWRARVAEVRGSTFMDDGLDDTDQDVRIAIINALDDIETSNLSRGGEFVQCSPNTEYRPDWYVDPRLGGVCNHATRAHMSSDLHRYLYAACYAGTRQRSPDLRDFPLELLPGHRNAHRSARDGAFDDRFHVQLPDRPSATVPSHLAKDGHYFIHFDASQCRSMTVREVARLQTFPDNYFFCGPRTAQYTQVGNAVPPLLAHEVAVSVFRLLKKSGFEL